MNILATRTISDFNKRYNVVYAKEVKIPLCWDNTCQKITSIVFNGNGNKKNNNLYNDIYELCLEDKIDIDTLINHFNIELIKFKTTNENNNIVDILRIYDSVIEKLNYYISFINHNNIRKDGQLFVYYFYEILSNSLLRDEHCDKYVSELIMKLITDATNISSSLNILRKILTNGLQQSTENCANFTIKMINEINKVLESTYVNNKIDIYNIISIITNIGTIMNDEYFENSDKILYKYCYSKWAEHLIKKISCNDDKTINKTLIILNNIEEYISNDLNICYLNKLFLEFIDVKMKQYDGYDLNNIKKKKNHLNYFNTLMTILEMSYTLLSGWNK